MFHQLVDCPSNKTCVPVAADCPAGVPCKQQFEAHCVDVGKFTTRGFTQHLI